MKYIACLIVMIALSTSALAQNKVITDTVTVSGNCDMCKKRIENAAYLPGVKKAEWSAETQKLVVIYNSEKTSLLTIEESVAKVGHDTEHLKADEEAYRKIHYCCRYRTDEKH